MTARKSLLGLALSALLLSTTAGAQSSVSLGGKASTLGLGGEVTLRVAPAVALRGGYNFLSISRTEEIEGISYDISPELSNGTALLDLHPFRSAFRLTGGVVLNQNELVLGAVPTQPVTIGNRTYQPSEIGRLDGLVTVNDLSPYLGLGFGGNGRVALTFDLGVVFHGTPQIALSGTTPLTGAEKATFDAEVARERAEIQAAINDESLAKYYPVLAVGLKFRL